MVATRSSPDGLYCSSCSVPNAIVTASKRATDIRLKDTCNATDPSPDRRDAVSEEEGNGQAIRASSRDWKGPRGSEDTPHSSLHREKLGDEETQRLRARLERVGQDTRLKIEETETLPPLDKVDRHNYPTTPYP